MDCEYCLDSYACIYCEGYGCATCDYTGLCYFCCFENIMFLLGFYYEDDDVQD